MDEKLIPLTVETDFSDGSLSHDFAALGYDPVIWKAYKVRNIPRKLAERVKASGGQLMLPEEGMTEEVYHPFTPPVTVPTKDVIERYRKQYASELKARVMCSMEHGWSNGMLREQFAALDRPPELGFGEIVKLPHSLIKQLESDGFEYTTDAGEMEQFEGAFQVRFERRTEAWRKGQTERVQAEEARQEAHQRVRDVRTSALAKIAKAAKLTPDELEALGL